MEFLQNIFWNSDENRLRTGYRIVLQLIAIAVISIPLRFIMERPANPSIANLNYTIFKAISGIITMLLSIWIITRFVDKRPLGGVGLNIDKNWWIDLFAGMALGALLMGSIFFVELNLGWITISEEVSNGGNDASITTLLIFFLFFIKVGFNEELLTRGYLLTNLSEGLNFKSLGPKRAIYLSWFLTSILFGAMHLANPNATLIAGLNIAAAGIFLGTAFVLTGRLAFPIGLHITWNFFQGNIFGFPVSGMKTVEGSTLITITQGGPDVWTGGAFGPEAGVIGIIAIILGTLLTVLWVRAKEGTVKLHLPIAESPEQPGALLTEEQK
jgi:CAAX protease family protein